MRRYSSYSRQWCHDENVNVTNVTTRSVGNMVYGVGQIAKDLCGVVAAIGDLILGE